MSSEENPQKAKNHSTNNAHLEALGQACPEVLRGFKWIWDMARHWHSTLLLQSINQLRCLGSTTMRMVAFETWLWLRDVVGKGSYVCFDW